MSHNSNGSAFSGGYSQTTVRVKVTIELEASASDRFVSFDYIRCQKDGLKAKGLTVEQFEGYKDILGNNIGDFSYSGEFLGDYAPDQNSTSGYIVVSTSDFTTRPNGDFTEAEGILKSAYLDNDDNVQVKTHESIYDTEVPGILMSNHAYANPYKLSLIHI